MMLELFYQQSKVYLASVPSKKKKDLFLWIWYLDDGFHQVLSLLCSQSYLGCCYLKSELFFFFFTRFCLSWVVSPIWAVVISRQNLSFFSFTSGSVSLGEFVHFRLVFIL